MRLGRTERSEPVGRQSVGEQPRLPHRLQPAVLDRVNPITAADPDDAIPVRVRGRLANPGHRPRALSGKPVVRGPDVVNGPHKRLRLLSRGSDVGDEPRDGRVLREMQHLPRFRSHPSSIPQDRYSAQPSSPATRGPGRATPCMGAVGAAPALPHLTPAADGPDAHPVARRPTTITPTSDNDCRRASIQTCKLRISAGQSRYPGSRGR
jgi:hypothetical protein